MILLEVAFVGLVVLVVAWFVSEIVSNWVEHKAGKGKK